MSSTLAANMRATAEAFILAFDGQWAPDATMAQRAPNCEHIMLPASLGNTGKKTNEEWLARFTRLYPLITEAKMTINDYLAVPEEHRAVARSSMTATTKAGPYSCEYVWFFTFDETGQKVISLTEFLDSKSAKDIVARFEEAGLLQNH